MKEYITKDTIRFRNILFFSDVTAEDIIMKCFEFNLPLFYQDITTLVMMTFVKNALIALTLIIMTLLYDDSPDKCL